MTQEYKDIVKLVNNSYSNSVNFSWHKFTCWNNSRMVNGRKNKKRPKYKYKTGKHSI